MAAVVNTGDDFIKYGLKICPDLDTISYTLSGLVNPETGWGRIQESYNSRATLADLGDDPWFALGDKDIGLHMFRTELLAEGYSLTQVTERIATAFGIEPRLLPMSNEPVATMVLAQIEGREGKADTMELEFQEYFVKHHHQPKVLRVRYDGIASAKPTKEVLTVLEDAETIVIAPSNPILSIGPILALEGVFELLNRRRDRVVAVSPIISGKAVKGPLAQILESLLDQHDVRTVAELYREIASGIVIDRSDADLAGSIEEIGLKAHLADTLMSTRKDAARLAELTLEALR